MTLQNTIRIAVALAVVMTSFGCSHIEPEKKRALVVADSYEIAQIKVRAAGGMVSHELPILSGVGALLPARSVERLSNDQEIQRIIIDDAQSITVVEEHSASPEAIEWLSGQTGRTPQNPWLESLVNRSEHGLTGRGIGLAIIDTGVAGRAGGTNRTINIAAGYDAILNVEGKSLRDATGHGSHLASLITGAGETWKGIAPGASLIAVKAFSASDKADFLDVIRAVQWVLDNKERYGIRVLNLSISASNELPYHLDPLNQALTAAWNAGLVVVVSAGNQGPEQSTVTAPGNNPWLVTVGASYLEESGEDVRVAPFSGRGPTTSGHIKPNIVAPGVRLAGILPSDAKRPPQEPKDFTQDGLWVTSGASQASAVVAGMITLLLEARPELSNNDIKCLIANTASPVAPIGQKPVTPMAQGRGLINFAAALKSQATQCEERMEGMSADTIIEGAYLGASSL